MCSQVLVVDDHALIRMATQQLINCQTELNCVAAVDNLDSAAEILAAEHVDLIVCDLQFESVNALPFIAEWTASDRMTKVLVCSAHRPQSYAPLCAQAGASGYLHKSANCEQLLAAIEHVQRGTDEFFGWDLSIDCAEQNHSRLASLTCREWEVLYEIGKGRSTKQIAANLFLSAKTIESHRASLKRKLAIDSKDYLVSFAAELSLAGIG